jgi:hypothetical protein
MSSGGTKGMDIPGESGAKKDSNETLPDAPPIAPPNAPGGSDSEHSLSPTRLILQRVEKLEASNAEQTDLLHGIKDLMTLLVSLAPGGAEALARVAAADAARAADAAAAVDGGAGGAGAGGAA